MNIGVIAFNVIAVVLIALVVWWFFANKLKPSMAAKDMPVKIVVKDGVYQPSLIQIPAHKQVMLHFVREDDSACSKTVVFTQLKLSYELPLNQVVTISLPPQDQGEIDFTCQMGMYRGKIIVVD